MVMPWSLLCVGLASWSGPARMALLRGAFGTHPPCGGASGQTDPVANVQKVPLRDVRYVSMVPFGFFNVVKVPFESSAMS